MPSSNSAIVKIFNYLRRLMPNRLSLLIALWLFFLSTLFLPIALPSFSQTIGIRELLIRYKIYLGGAALFLTCLLLVISVMGAYQYSANKVTQRKKKKRLSSLNPVEKGFLALFLHRETDSLSPPNLKDHEHHDEIIRLARGLEKDGLLEIDEGYFSYTFEIDSFVEDYMRGRPQEFLSGEYLHEFQERGLNLDDRITGD